MICKHFSKCTVPLSAVLLTTLACLTLIAATPAHAAPVWTERFGGSQGMLDYPNSAVVDSHDNILVAGSVVDIAGTESAAVVKYDSAGHQLWTQSVPLDTNNVGESVAVDTSDNVTVVAQGSHYDDDGDIRPTAYLLRYSSAGKLYSQTDISIITYRNRITNVFASPNGDTTLVGTNYSEDDEFGSQWNIERFDSNGTLLWSDSYSGNSYNGDNVTKDAAIDSQGNLIVAGSETDFDGSTFPISLVLRKYSPTGNVLYTSIYKDAIEPGDDSTPTAMVLDQGGNAYVAGQLTDYYSYETLLLRVKPDGGFMWARHYSVSGSNSIAFPTDLALDHSGDVVVAGEEGGNFFAHVAYKPVLLKYNPSGHRLYTTHPAALRAGGVDRLFAGSKTNDLYAVGIARSYDPSTGQDSASTQIITKIDPSGNAQDQENYTGSTEAPGEFQFEGATFDPLLDAVYTINVVDFTPGTNLNSTTDTDWVTAKYRLGG